MIQLEYNNDSKFELFTSPFGGLLGPFFPNSMFDEMLLEAVFCGLLVCDVALIIGMKTAKRLGNDSKC